LSNSTFLVVNSRLIEPDLVTHCTVSFYFKTDDATGVVLKVTVQTAVVANSRQVTVIMTGIPDLNLASPSAVRRIEQLASSLSEDSG
jgi:hypothetical protein